MIHQQRSAWCGCKRARDRSGDAVFFDLLGPRGHPRPGGLEAAASTGPSVKPLDALADELSIFVGIILQTVRAAMRFQGGCVQGKGQ